MKIVTAKQMQKIDKTTIEERGIPSLMLMERAGEMIAREILQQLETESIVIVTGKGNNAGDGFVVARHLDENNVRVRCAMLAPPNDLSGDAETNYDRLPITVDQIIIQSAQELKNAIGGFEWVGDAILGTGIKGAVRGLFGEAIDVINESGIPVVAIDSPTGLPADGTPPEGSCIHAAFTVTVGLPKLGMMVYPGFEYTGRLVVVDIGFPEDLLNDDEILTHVIDDDLVQRALPERLRNSHKGTYGSVLIVGGSPGMTGAAIMSAQSALRSGVGLVFVAIPEAANFVYEAQCVEALSIPLQPKKGQFLDMSCLDKILDETQRMTAMAVGPGLGQHKETQELIRALIEKTPVPLVIDADGLNALVGHTDILKKRDLPTVLTPHPGEMARLIDSTPGDVQKARIDIATDFARRHNVQLILKGAQSVVADPDGRIFINPTGNSGLAKGGSGDVLTGLLSGLLAQRTSSLNACIAATYIHGLAGDLASQIYGTRALVPGDVILEIGNAFLSVENPDDAATFDSYST